jgi:hypothetical protein
MKHLACLSVFFIVAGSVDTDRQADQIASLKRENARLNRQVDHLVPLVNAFIAYPGNAVKAQGDDPKTYYDVLCLQALEVYKTLGIDYPPKPQ